MREKLSIFLFILSRMLAMKNFKLEQFRQNFPLICSRELHYKDVTNPSPLVYFDNGATTQKPSAVISCYHAFYQNINANVHRSSHKLSAKATSAFEQARQTIQLYINAKSEKEIIWTKGTTESINLIAECLGGKILTAEDEILIAVSEHHANIVPWQEIAKKTGALIKVIPLDENGRVDVTVFKKLITNKTKIVCCAHISNVTGKINAIAEIIKQAKTVEAITVIDGAQAIAHIPVDVQALDCDFYAFSAHKIFGPTGMGVLYGKQALLENMPPYQYGGEMIETVSFTNPTTFNALPFKFEAGTPNIAGSIAFAEAINFMNQYNYDEFAAHEQKLTQYIFQALKRIPKVRFIFKQLPDIPLISFTMKEHHNHDIASSLDSYGIAIRSGHHCSMPLMEYLNISGCLRVSLSAYNTFTEIDYFIDSLIRIIEQETVKGLPDSKQAIGLCTSTIISNFSKLKSWDSKHREIMLLGKNLERLDLNKRNEISLINGCESLAWLVGSKDSQGIYTFNADSDAKIIRGLLVIVLAAYNQKSAEEIKSFNIQCYFENLGLMQHLSPSRGNGVLAIVDKIQTLVK